MTLDTIIHASPHQVSCDLGGEAAILNLHTGFYYSLDPVGAAVWKLIEQPRAVADIRDAMLGRFEVEPERCELDLFQLFEKLAAEGLIETRDGHS
jgi:hypothetical protein